MLINADLRADRGAGDRARRSDRCSSHHQPGAGTGADDGDDCDHSYDDDDYVDDDGDDDDDNDDDVDVGNDAYIFPGYGVQQAVQVPGYHHFAEEGEYILMIRLS